MTTTIETPRLFLRPFDESDADMAHAWFSDPDVMRFIPRGGISLWLTLSGGLRGIGRGRRSLVLQVACRAP